MQAAVAAAPAAPATSLVPSCHVSHVIASSEVGQFAKLAII